MTDFGDLLAALRRGRISQTDLAVRAATSQAYISRVESGDVQPTITQAKHLARCLGYELKLSVEPLPSRSDQAGLPDQLVMNAEERMQSAAALHNATAALRAGVTSG